MTVLQYCTHISKWPKFLNNQYKQKWLMFFFLSVYCNRIIEVNMYFLDLSCVIWLWYLIMRKFKGLGGVSTKQHHFNIVQNLRDHIHSSILCTKPCSCVNFDKKKCLTESINNGIERILISSIKCLLKIESPLSYSSRCIYI